jgi:hypothetical protein
MEYNRILKQGCHIYIEVPAPDCERHHEYNLNHYSILTQKMLAALLLRTGFDIARFETLEFTLKMPGVNNTVKDVKERFFCIVATKTRPLDVK